MNARSPAETIAQARAMGPVKVWSLVVTVFGDLAPAHGGVLTSQQLNALFDVMEIRGEALRVALHRLRKDGWIESTRQGRGARYRMSPRGTSETRAVRHKIYGPPERLATPWHIWAVQGALPDGALRVTSGLVLLRAGQTAHGGWPLTQAQTATTDALPRWVSQQLVPPETQSLARDLLQFLDPALRAGAPTDTDVLRRMALRILVLHHWRRLALRDGTWALMALDPHGDMARCAAAVHATLEAIPVELLPSA